ncbi:MAG: GNAT family N-acetyltransferase [Acetobacteraceae bacterium]|nr:GNAT family N-acetyltransferase [Acetobacteraceae bacterium]
MEQPVQPPPQSPPGGHAAWVAQAVPPPGVVLAREEGRLDVAEFVEVIRRSGLNRPVAQTERIAAMLAHANLVVTAREATAGGQGRLIGVARSLTDFAYCCYLSDLCVDAAWQGKGVGRALVAETKRIVGPGSMLLLLSAPAAMDYYPRIGMERVANGFIIRRDG